MTLACGKYMLDRLRPPTAGARGGVHGIEGAEVAREGDLPRLHLDQDRAVRPVQPLMELEHVFRGFRQDLPRVEPFGTGSPRGFPGFGGFVPQEPAARGYQAGLGGEVSVAGRGGGYFSQGVRMFVACHPFVAGQPLHVDLPAAGVEVVNLLDDIPHEVLAGLPPVRVRKGSDGSLVVGEDGQVSVGF